jgi:predicted 3-demethylubiquinone-9 3-methyltransferase (glyoxalase superfamily)
MRLTANGEWPLRLIRNAKRSCSWQGDKSGVSERAFYRQLITKADKRFDAHLNRLKQKEFKEKESKQQELKKKKGSRPCPEM